ncbi:MAG: hypothetical protein N3E40_00075, partial [Dehalococcoidia bacterium]|nr:hypothetical protein [Dehalococcoidia bacterium]
MNWLEWLLEPRKAEAGVIIPNAFKSRVISEVAKRIGGYPKTATGRSILEALESKGAIPSGAVSYTHLTLP